jgi:sugar phosphate isomerase/epimerase
MFQCLNTGAISLSVSFDEAVKLATQSGFAGVDLPVNELIGIAENRGVQEIQARLQEAGLRSGGWGLPVDFRSSEDAYQAGLAKLPQYAKLARTLGSTRCSTWILPFSDTLDYEANMDLHAHRLRPIAQILKDHDCQLGLEFVGPKTMREGHTYEFISTMSGIFELSGQIGTGNVGLLLDCWHWYTSHGTVDDVRQLNAEQVVYVHVNDAPAHRSIDAQIDNQRLLPGDSGVIDIAGFLGALQNIGYDGPVVVEPFNAELVELPAEERVQAVKKSLDKIWSQANIG